MTESGVGGICQPHCDMYGNSTETNHCSQDCISSSGYVALTTGVTAALLISGIIVQKLTRTHRKPDVRVAAEEALEEIELEELEEVEEVEEEFFTASTGHTQREEMRSNREAMRSECMVGGLCGAMSAATVGSMLVNPLYCTMSACPGIAIGAAAGAIVGGVCGKMIGNDDNDWLPLEEQWLGIIDCRRNAEL